MKKSIFLVAIFSVLNCYIVYGQLEVKFYTGLIDRFGLAAEYAINDRTGVEFGGSFHSMKTDRYYNPDFIVDAKETSIFINSKIKRYTANTFLNTRFFYGAYLRYWQYAEVASDIETWTPSQRKYAADNKLWLSTREHKISVGGLIGLKGKLLKSLTWEVTSGVGFSPPFLYTYGTKTTQGNVKGKVGPDEGDWGIGYLNHLSLLGHISIGYKF